MKIIIPMAGMGKRMRPHTLTIPKPLIPVAGKPIVQRLVEDIAKVCDEAIAEIVFIIGDFGEKIEAQLKEIASSLGAKGVITYQKEALGTAHAILCAGDSLEGNVVVAFADTLFIADFVLDKSQDGIIWTSYVENPNNFGVVKFDDNGMVQEFVEKPAEFVSDQAIIGIYYFKDGENLRKELQYLIDNDIRINGGEFGLTDALENMKNNGLEFKMGSVDEWLDCGNKDATVHTNQRILAGKNGAGLVSDTITKDNSVILEPCFIGENVQINNSIVGPHVSIGANSVVENSIIRNSIIQTNSHIKNANLHNSMLGNYVDFISYSEQVSLSDYSTQN